MMFKTIFITIILMLIAGGVGFFAARGQELPFNSLSTSEMYETIINQRDFAIQKAKEAGDYKCCINPPCTMCYMEANKWNNYKIGTCACDELITEGITPCPQCEQGLCEESAEGACKVK